MTIDYDDIDYGDSHLCRMCDHVLETHRCAGCGEVVCEGCTEDGAWVYDEDGERYCCSDCAMTPEEYERDHGSLRDSERTSL